MDTTIECIECEKRFVFSASEQEYFQSLGFSAPVRCKPCRKLKKEKDYLWKGGVHRNG